MIKFAEHEASIRQMLKAVIAPETINEFLVEMTEGRFEYLTWGPGCGINQSA